MFEIEKYAKEFFQLEEPTAKKLWVLQYDEMSIHTQGKKPVRLINKRRPYEDEGIKKYRIDAYEPITKEPVVKAIDQICRTFNNANVIIKMSNDLQEYVSKPVFKKVNFLAYINKFATRRMIEDPNGVLIWFPTGEGATKVKTVRVEVEPILVLSKNIKHFTEDVFSFISKEKSTVIVNKGNKQVESKEGDVYYVITKQGYFKYIQYGKKAEKKFKMELHYAQEFDVLPVIILGGYEVSQVDDKTNDDIEYFSSYFSGFLAYANETVRQFSDHQGIMTVSGFPMREVTPIECPSKCRHGKIFVMENEIEVQKMCETCDGTGTITPASPYGVLIRPIQTAFGEKGKERVPMLSYISPDVSILKYSGEYWKSLLDESRRALNLLFIEEAQSGVAKDIDRETLLSTLDVLGINIYENIVKNSLIIISKLRNISTQEEISINHPPSYKIKTEKEIYEEVTTNTEKGAPDILMQESTRQLLHKKFAGDKTLLRMCDLLFIIDPYFHYDIATKMQLFASTSITEETYQKSLNANNVALKYFRLNKEKIPEMSDESIMAAIEKELDIVIKKVTPEPPEPVFDPAGKPV